MLDYLLAVETGERIGYRLEITEGPMRNWLVATTIAIFGALSMSGAHAFCNNQEGVNTFWTFSKPHSPEPIEVYEGSTPRTIIVSHIAYRNGNVNSVEFVSNNGSPNDRRRFAAIQNSTLVISTKSLVVRYVGNPDNGSTLNVCLRVE